MKLEVAIAALMSTEALSCELFSFQFNSRALAENDGNRMKMMELFSELNAGSGRKNPAFQKRQRHLSNSAMRGQQQHQDNADNLDLGILEFDEDYRRLDECPPDEEIRDFFVSLHSNPYIVQFDSMCEILKSSFPDACNVCEFPAAVDNETGLETGTYHMKIDCPGLIDVVNCTCIAPLEPMCETYALFPGGGPLCETCNSDYENWFIDNENCVITDEMRIAFEDYGGPPVDGDVFADQSMADEDLVAGFFPACKDAASEEESSVEEPVEEVPVVVESDEGTEEKETAADEGTEEKDAAAVTSAGEMLSTPMSTILRVVLVGASLFWVAA